MGATLIEVLVVIAIVIVLAILLLPLRDYGSGMSRQSICAKNQSQIMGAFVAYAQQEAVIWPAPWATTIGHVQPGQAITAGVAAMNYTFGCFEVLANAASLPNRVFHCPTCAAAGPNTLAQPGQAQPELSGSNWADDGGGAGGKRIAYAFDWADPGDSGGDRILLCDRDLGNHKGKGVMACYGVSHAKFLRKPQPSAAPPAPAETIGMTGVEVVVGEVISDAGSDDATSTLPPDDIFNSVGDYPAGTTEAETALKPGGGDPNRVFVK